MSDCRACKLSGPDLFFSLFPVPHPRLPHRRAAKVPYHLFAGSGWVVEAPTKGEARAKLKAAIGKLPPGFYLSKVA